MINQLTEDVAKELVEKRYIVNCRRRAQEHINDKDMFQGYNDLIDLVQECTTLKDVIEFIQDDGDYYEDPTGVMEFLMESLVEDQDTK